MAQTVPVAIPGRALTVQAGVGAYNLALGIQQQNAQGNNQTRGQYTGLAVYDSVGVGVLVTFAVFRDAGLTDLVHEFQVLWPGGASSAEDEPRIPKHFFAGLWVACWSAVGGQTFRCTPDLLHVAGV